MRHIPRKRFGQHFLVDGGLIDEIVRVIAPAPGETLVEIGPGLGALTLPLLQHTPKLHVVELDRDLAAHWRKEARVAVTEADVLRVAFNLESFPSTVQVKSSSDATVLGAISKLRVVGNLPYNISTPILFHLLDFVDQIQDQHFMLQKEVIDRMVAEPCTAAYGRLSVALQWRYEMENFLAVPPEAFDPPPRVQSAVVRMIPRAEPAPVQRALLEEIVQVAFSQRRKILRNTLGKWLDARGFAGEFDLQRRAEEVPVTQFVGLAQACAT